MYQELNIKQKASEFDSFTKQRYIQFIKYFKKKKSRILDVGCNTGRGGNEIRKHFPSGEIFGLDCVEERLEKIPSGIYKSKLVCLSSCIPIEDSFFDIIVAGEFIEHLRNDDIAPTLSEFYRILKKGGIILLTTPNPEGIIMKLLGRKVIGGSHLSEHYHKRLQKKLEKHGFKKIKKYGTGRVSNFIGTKFPLFFYNSYLMKGIK